jgi:hypothetical protein
MRIGAGQGFYGDTPDGAVAVAERGGVSYICCDALAELTMAILQKDRRRDQGGGFARDLPAFMRALLPTAREQRIRIITNAGGMNPAAAARAVKGVADELGITGLRVASVTGDNLSARIDELLAAGSDLCNMDTGADLATIRDRIVFAVAYLGARPIVDALERGADVVVNGRLADASGMIPPRVLSDRWSMRSRNCLQSRSRFTARPSAISSSPKCTTTRRSPLRVAGAGIASAASRPGALFDNLVCVRFGTSFRAVG